MPTGANVPMPPHLGERVIVKKESERVDILNSFSRLILRKYQALLYVALIFLKVMITLYVSMVHQSGKKYRNLSINISHHFRESERRLLSHSCL